MKKISNNRNFKLEQLKMDWLNRGGNDYLTIKQMILNNEEFRSEQKQLVEDKNDRLISLCEKNLQIVVEGFNSRTSKYDEQVDFNLCVSTTFPRFRNLVDMEQSQTSKWSQTE